MRNNLLKYFSFIFTLTLIISCGGGGGDEGAAGGGGGINTNPPGKATLTAPANNKTCETGTNVSATQSEVTFTWSASANTSSYDLKVTNLTTNAVINKTGLTGTSTKVTLVKSLPYSWNITSRSTSGTNTTATSDTWKFYLAGLGVANYAPFPADLKTPTLRSTVSLTDGKATFTWDGSDPDEEDTLTYTLYVDSTDGKQTPPDEQKGLSVQTLDVALDAATTYYWRVKTSDGTNTSFSVMSNFKTE